MMPWKILVLADAAPAAQRYQRLLCGAGQHVRCGRIGAAEMHSARAGNVDATFVVLTNEQTEPADVLREFKTVGSISPVIVVSRNETVRVAVEAMREGAVDYLREPCSVDDLVDALSRLESPGPPATDREASDEMPEAEAFQGMVGRCPAMQEVIALIKRIAPSAATVLVTGESGTGKEVAVRAIHRLSGRRNNAFMACDCTALAPTLLESELFGHVKGSFSGAIATKNGLFEAAHQGTLMLDEVSNLSMETQGKLLRVLETRQIRMVGDTAEREVDIRLIATTNRSLAEMVKVGAFRADLYYRLNVVPIALPPLRERHGDIPLLATVFLRDFSRRMHVEMGGVSPDAMRQLEVYPWPGNVRELHNIVERLAVLYGGTRIELEHLPIEVREAKATLPPSEIPRSWEECKMVKKQFVDDLERRFLTAALDRCSQNVTHAAASVGMQRPNFHALLRHHGLKSGSKRNR